MTSTNLGAACALLCVAFAGTAGAAHAADWTRQEFAQDHFAIQLPVALTATKAPFAGPDGQALTETVYRGAENGATFEVAVVDLSALKLEQQAVLDYGVKTVIGAGKVRVSVAERIDRVFGRELTIEGPDGSQAMASVFFVGGKLYMLQGRAPPAASEGEALRFQQSLEFIGYGFEAGRPENRQGFGPPPDGQGPGGQGPGGGFGRRRGPPQQAFIDCKGKSEGDEVQHTTPFGVVPARCVTTPQGLAARPDRPPRGGPPDGGPPPEGQDGGPPPDQDGPPPGA